MTRSNAAEVWARRQVSEVRRGGSSVFIRKVKYAVRRIRFLNVVSGVWAIPTVLGVRVATPLMRIRVGTIFSTRIGHFVTDGAEQVARLDRQPVNTVDWFWLGPTCNSQWEAMLRRTLPIRGWVKYVDWWNQVLPGGESHVRPSSLTKSRDVEGLFIKRDVKLPFRPEESEAARAWLRSHGWREGDPFVCLLVRDSAYLDGDPLHGLGENHDKARWSYHDYRDTDIETYVPAIKWLAEQGVWVLRMGKVMSKPLEQQFDRVIDYAFDPGKSDLLDIWLFANCAGCVSNSSGPDALADVYQRPALYINAVPLSHLRSFSSSIWVPKNLVWAVDSAPLTLSEHLRHNYGVSQRYAESGISLVDLAPTEITLAVQEFWQRIEGTRVDRQSEQDRQEQFWRVFRAWPEFSRFHGWMHPDTRVGAAWLASQSEVFLREGPSDSISPVSDW